MLKPFAARDYSKMQEVLKDPQASGPEIDYYMIRGGKDKTNVTVWETGTVGGEYIKTYGHYHVGAIDETYWVVAGEGIVLLQKRVEEDGQPVDNKIEQFIAIKVKAGDQIFIPSGMGHLVVNTGSKWLVTVDDSPVNFEEADPVSLPGHADYEPLKKLQGFAYYVMDENGEAVLVKNEKYSQVPEATWMTPGEWQSQHVSSAE